MQRLASITEDAGWQGRVTVSHASGLADLSVPEATSIAERFSELGISITSTVPIFRNTTVIHCPLIIGRHGSALESFAKYKRSGINIALGTDTFPPDMFQNVRCYENCDG